MDVTGLVVAAASAFGVVFLAELGDKTQLVALGFGARHKLGVVVAGLVVGFGTVGAIAAIVGGVLGAALPDRPIAIVGGTVFLAFAAWTLWGVFHPDGDDDGEPQFHSRSVILTIALGIAVAELGDKTQIATATLAAQDNPVAVWVGATAGEVCAATVGATIGKHLGARLDRRLLQFASATLFAVFGAVLLLTA